VGKEQALNTQKRTVKFLTRKPEQKFQYRPERESQMDLKTDRQMTEVKGPGENKGA
jgi:hypothetical protein